MGLATDSIKDTFTFIFRYPKSILIALLFAIIISLGSLIVEQGVIVTIIYYIIIVFISLILTSAYQLIVYRAVRENKVNLTDTILTSLKKLPKIFIAALISLVILLPITPLLVFIFTPFGSQIYTMFSQTFSDLIAFGIAMIVLIICGGIALYLGLKIFLTFPILMIENKEPIDSIKASWNKTKNYELSILGANILLGLIIKLITLPADLLGFLFAFFGLSYIALILNVITTTISSTLFGVFLPVYYLNRQQEKKSI